MKWHYHYYCITHNDDGILNKVVVERAKRLVGVFAKRTQKQQSF